MPLQIIIPRLLPLVGDGVFTGIGFGQVIAVQIFLQAANAITAAVVQLVAFIDGKRNDRLSYLLAVERADLCDRLW